MVKNFDEIPCLSIDNEYLESTIVSLLTIEFLKTRASYIDKYDISVMPKQNNKK